MIVNIMDQQIIILKSWKWSLVLPIFEFKPRQNIFVHKNGFSRIVNSILLISLRLLDYFLSMYEAKFSIGSLAIHLETITATITTILILFNIHSHTKDILMILRKINGIPKKLRSIGVIFPGIVQRKNSILLFIHLTDYVCSVLVESTLVIIEFGFLSYIDVISYYFSSLVIFDFHLLYIVLGIALDFYLRAFNSFAKVDNFQMEVEQIVKLFDGFHNTIEECHRIFSYTILIDISHQFTSILFSFFWAIINGESLSSIRGVLFFFVNCSWVFCFIYRIMCFVVTFASVEQESKLAVENIYDIQTRIGRKNLPYKSMELFLLKSKLNELKFSVCGFFPLDWSLIYSMVAGITTYLVYLIQFREMEQDRIAATTGAP
ncbi:gustatory receptor 68a-like [Harmonia axyridis]|uniref:gustatory receptor 68a-like n=1 Tax=Harmonia axyridis TaxID=115357 RepID=UPI001E2772B2|nr:gustatory receptor 68a-like [Harmonia axyridis]